MCTLVDKHKVISFDIYDTALLRNVLYPTDIFEIVSRELEENDIFLKDFKKMRISAEEKARKFSQSEDVTLEDIYQVISGDLGEQLSQTIKKIELSIEREFTVSNPFIKEVYNYAKANNKEIIFISDMYLPKEFITNLLIENGYDQFEDIFISGSIGVSKASTNLYSHVRKEMNINSSWLHIGDNMTSDYENALKCNLSAYYYKDIRTRAGIKKVNSIELSIMKAIQINYCESTEELNYWQRFGVNTVSSLFFGFTLWLINQVKGKDNVHFLARDGYLPYKLFLKMSDIIEGLPKANYLYASRRAYQIPNILNMEQSDALELLTAYNPSLGQRITIGEIFDNICLNREKYDQLIRNFGFYDFNDEIKTDNDRARAKEVLKSIYTDVTIVLQREKSLLEKYLIQNGVYECNELHVVDVGWRGSTQKAIKDITGIETDGYYFGTTHNVYDDILDHVHGYAFNLGKSHINAEKIMDNVMMYELVFSAPHGSLIGFREENEIIYPVLKEVENNSFLYECLSDVHSSVIVSVDKYIPYYKYLKNINIKDCLDGYFEFIEAKRYEDLIEFTKLSSVVGIGNSQDSQKYVTCTSIQEYYKNKRKIEQDINKNLWKNTLIIQGSLSELKRKDRSKKLQSMLGVSWITKEKIIKAIKNPRKAVKFIERRIKYLMK